MGLDERGHLVVFNPKAVAITGVAREEALGHDAFPLFFPERAEDVRKAMLAATDQGPVTLEEPLTTRSGARRTVRWHVSTRSNDAAKRTFVAIGVDVTDQRALERTAVQNERLAAVGALAAGLAHEIRNPLNGANLHMAILERALRKWQGAPISIPETIGVVTGELQRLSGLVSDFLEVARPKPLNRTAWDANEVARGCVFLMAPAAEARQVALTLEDAPLPYSLMLDGERMKQVLVNLVQNAMEAISKPGGHVVVRVRRTPSHGEFEVEDDGVGLNDPKAPIFDAFYTTKETGTGLGLSIVHRIVTDHGGTIEVSSVPGCTRFTIRIPLAGI
jgi:PAS domain S-box-containing protein